MAYYAQLRAALCILANLGVGLFNGLNFAVEANGNIARIDPPNSGSPNAKGMGTHQIVWTTLDQWGKDATLSQLFLDLLKFKHIPLRDILETLWPGFISVTTVGTLISAWGIDLKRGMDERTNRNNSSYAPQALNPIATRTATNLGFVDRTWRLFEPSGGSGFDNLDRHILRRLLIAQHHMSDSGTDLSHGSISANYSSLPASIRLFCSQTFVLSTPSQPDLFRNADAKVSPSKPLHMLSRALLLLRLAIAFTHSSLTDAGINVSAGELAAWLDELAIERGFCSNGTSIGNGSGLWDDITLAIEDLTSSRKPAPADLIAWKTKTPNGLPLISEVERIPLWSLCA